ncbi:SMI1/KNR4 family protein [Tissierella praeacuta]|uniref:SMI1/KNR4 family protein n=1 Tax=Tissierella praeacuta TaxID=43131 RepID=UPI003341A981
MNIAEKYIRGLQKAYCDNGQKDEWEHFASLVNGVCEADLAQLRILYPNIPKSLVELLKFVDGTYHKEYKGEKIVFYFLGSDVEEYPYYLLSAKEMIENKNEAFEYYADYIDRMFDDDVKVDAKIIDNSKQMNWLHFSDCMNNGGTSQLFIDFSPSESGVNGQIIRFLHDPDEIKVIASKFDEYLQMLFDSAYDFICDDEV